MVDRGKEWKKKTTGNVGLSRQKSDRVVVQQVLVRLRRSDCYCTNDTDCKSRLELPAPWTSPHRKLSRPSTRTKWATAARNSSSTSSRGKLLVSEFLLLYESLDRTSSSIVSFLTTLYWIRPLLPTTRQVPKSRLSDQNSRTVPGRLHSTTCWWSCSLILFSVSSFHQSHIGHTLGVASAYFYFPKIIFTTFVLI